MSVLTRVRRRIFSNRRRPLNASLTTTAANDAEESPLELGNERKILSEAQLADWAENGYLVLPRFMPHGRLRDLSDQLDALWRDRKKDDRGLIVDVFTGTHRERRIPLAKATDRARAKPYKLNDLYLDSVTLRETLLDPELVEVLDDLLEGAPILCNSVSMERGTQQRLHVDTFYVAPPEAGRMVGAMVLLEDTKPGSGPFRYYPGSHTIEPYRFSDGRLNVNEDELGEFDEYMNAQLAERGLEAIDFEGNAGDVFIWHPQLYNGGAPIEDMALTQKSVVGHYFRAKDVDPGLRSDLGGDRYFLERGHQPVS